MAGLRSGLRVEDLGHELVVLDAAGGRVHRLTGAAADAVRGVIAGAPLPARMQRTLRAIGVLAEDRTGPVDRGPDRRAVLAASALGVSTLMLPLPGAAASTDGLASGGDAYLDVTGMATASTAATGALQFVSYTATSGTRTAVPSAQLQVEVLLVAGGGGGAAAGGGGGGGAVTRSILTLDAGVTYDIVVGAGGAGSVAFTQAAGDDGSASTLARSGPSTELLRADGGGGGAYYGGAGGSSTYGGGSGTGTGYAPDHAFGGGGGAGGTGASAVGADGGEGGSGVTITGFVGADATYGGGGGGGGLTSGGAGGSGGGGGGWYDTGVFTPGSDGTDGLGGGGGGGSPYADGGDGGDGLVMIRYYGAQPQVNISFPAV